ncbi:AbrB/MazE/SpoVT family DNA-binding domain-containing protein [Enterococcus sp. AZ109]|uniref:AbrB/MazE/SpoVT family DNA-binding domain-containing protein n=1 Tax=Enterococcus sp. AZ109 TaxID=2774634 RepID=UPI003F25EDCB
MGELKIRKIGNSVGAIFPKEWGLEAGDVVEYTKDGDNYVLNTQDIAKEHDRQLIEESFAEFEAGKTLTEEQMKKAFGKYGWGD